MRACPVRPALVLASLANVAAAPSAAVILESGRPEIALDPNVLVDPATGAVRDRESAALSWAANGRVMPVPGGRFGPRVLRYTLHGVRAWDAESGRDLGVELPVDARYGILSEDGSLAIVRAGGLVAAYATADGHQLWSMADPWPAAKAPTWTLGGGALWWRSAASSQVVDAATGQPRWTLEAAEGGVRLVGETSCVVTAKGVEGTCPAFVPSPPLPAPAPGEVYTDDLAVLGRTGHGRAHEAAEAYAAGHEPEPIWPDRAGPRGSMEPLTPLVAGEALPVHAYTDAEGRQIPVPLRPGHVTLVMRGGSPWPAYGQSDVLWVDPPQYALMMSGMYGMTDEASFEPNEHGDVVYSELAGWEAAATALGLGADGDTLIVSGAGEVLYRGDREGLDLAATRLWLAEVDAPLPTRSVREVWRYAPPRDFDGVFAAPDGGVGGKARGEIVVLNANGKVRFRREVGLGRSQLDGDRLVFQRDEAWFALDLRTGEESPAAAPEKAPKPGPVTVGGLALTVEDEVAVAREGDVVRWSIHGVRWPHVRSLSADLASLQLARSGGTVIVDDAGRLVRWVPGQHPVVSGKLGFSWDGEAVIAWRLP